MLVLWLAGAALGGELPDLRSVPADLVVPPIQDGPPAPGVRVRGFLPDYEGTEVGHVLYLPTDWKPGTHYPVLVEYAGNGGYANQYGDVCTGLPEDSKLGYGISAGRGFLWLCLPYVEHGSRRICTRWWGDVDATLDYCRRAIELVCADYGGDPDALILSGFSRGAIACGYLGLHDDETARLWRAFIACSHYDGVTPWPYEGSDAASAIERGRRLNGRPSFVCHEGSVEGARKFLLRSGIDAPFTFQAVPFRNHSDAWVLRDTPARRALREWLAGVP
ncbi:MAG: hypothetical protein H7A45_14330 [Verrucomicrobiales bacterium]|nr:hypothetical protein [Verrucomicrobiales bacterium]MCP5526357.1 hypothetical protein [Verrucomicrobiales bacterium]